MKRSHKLPPLVVAGLVVVALTGCSSSKSSTSTTSGAQGAGGGVTVTTTATSGGRAEDRHTCRPAEGGCQPRGQRGRQRGRGQRDQTRQDQEHHDRSEAWQVRPGVQHRAALRKGHVYGLHRHLRITS